MKLLLENWRKYQLLTEAEDIYALYESQIITEAEFIDRIKKWAKRKGMPLAVAISLAMGTVGAGPAAAYAGETPVDQSAEEAPGAAEDKADAPQVGYHEDAKHYKFGVKVQGEQDVQFVEGTGPGSAVDSLVKALQEKGVDLEGVNRYEILSTGMTVDDSPGIYVVGIAK